MGLPLTVLVCQQHAHESSPMQLQLVGHDGLFHRMDRILAEEVHSIPIPPLSEISPLWAPEDAETSPCEAVQHSSVEIITVLRLIRRLVKLPQEGISFNFEVCVSCPMCRGVVTAAFLCEQVDPHTPKSNLVASSGTSAPPQCGHCLGGCVHHRVFQGWCVMACFAHLKVSSLGLA